MGWGELAQMVGGGIIGMSQGLINNQIMRNNQWPMGMTQLQLDNLANQQNINAQLDLWTKTNYPAQVEQLEKAGLNPALLYKSGGPGGTTAMAAGHVAPTAAGGQVDILRGMEVGAQLSLLKAQKENIEADTAKKLAEAPNIAQNEKLQWQLTWEKTMENTLKEISMAVKPDGTDAEQQIHDSAAVKSMLAGLMQNGIENKLKESSINVNDETVKKLSNDITQKVAEIAILSRSVSVEEQQVQINKKLAEFNTDWKNIIGKEAIETISGLIKNLPFAGLLKNNVVKPVKAW